MIKMKHVINDNMLWNAVIRVMEKAGFTLEKRYWYKGPLEAVKYVLDRDVYFNRRAQG